MLFHLTHTANNDQFKEMILAIMHALWPERVFLEGRDQLPAWPDPPNAHKRLEQTRSRLNDIVDKIAEKEHLYRVYSSNGAEHDVGFPFVDRYYRYFLQREWDNPERDPRHSAENLFRMEPPSPEVEKQEKGYVNWSRHCGNYYHFINVVAATARLIEYFSEPAHTHAVLDQLGAGMHRPTRQVDKLNFPNKPNLRTFILMLAAFYPDIGKTVESHRHGMEGANILANHTTRAVHQLQTIVGHYRQQGLIDDAPFDRDNLLFISRLIFYHDQFGTLGTGESSYLRLVDLIHRIRLYTVSEDMDKQCRYGNQCLFDLWVLNLADIMVSMERKYELQKELWVKNTAVAKIENFLNKNAGALKHDLGLALQLHEKHCESQHTDYLYHLESDAIEHSRHHAVERIRRLLHSLLVDHFPEYRAKHGANSPVVKMLEQMSGFTDAKWNSTISRSIYAIGDYVEFTKRFSWIGQMDYAFGFFIQIVKQALCHVNNELNKCSQSQDQNKDENKGEDSSLNTGWVYKPQSWFRTLDKEEDQFKTLTNAELFADNCAATIVQILHHLLFREEEISRLRNLEFWVASQRLTPEKIDRIIALEGPFRTRRAVQLALESIYLW
ncbi:MAG: hypothetical protein P8X63_04600 [Desulfuromonadaceae bacterium]